MLKKLLNLNFLKEFHLFSLQRAVYRTNLNQVEPTKLNKGRNLNYPTVMYH